MPLHVSSIIPETCEAIVREYLEEVMTCPSTPEKRKEVAKGFSDRWNFHLTCGVVDGKRVSIKSPLPSGGSLYSNYNKFHSIVLVALVDSQYRFMYISVGENRSGSDGGGFRECSLDEALEEGYVGLPEL